MEDSFMDDGLDSLVPTAAVEDPWSSLFPWPFFNLMQSEMFDATYHGNSSLALSAPTGCGKTVLFELAMVALFRRRTRDEKVVYLAPSKALCDERERDWQNRLGHLGVQVKAVTGDTVGFRSSQLRDVDIVVSTPEKWDSLSRSQSHRAVTSHVALFCVDEVHTIDSDRGATLEAVVTRMMTMRGEPRLANFPVSRLRILAVSATCPNVEDFGRWIGGSEQEVFAFGDEYRPTRLETVVLGFQTRNQNQFVFQDFLNTRLPLVIDNYSKRKPVLVFGNTRKGIIKTAKMLAGHAEELGFVESDDQRTRLSRLAEGLVDGDLRITVSGGVAFHSAGLSQSDRRAVESAFVNRTVKCVVTTSTLATGVNLPAHLVIVQGTSAYRQGTGYTDMTQQELIQIAGRAGRPQFDTSGVCVFMTTDSNVHKIRNVTSGMKAIESRLHEKPTECLNAEVVLGTIYDVSVAIQWIKSTFLYLRVHNNPSRYGLKPNASKRDKDGYFAGLVEGCMKELIDEKIVALDEDGLTYQSTKVGQIMARTCLTLKTVKNFKLLAQDGSISSALDVLCAATEYQQAYSLRRDEKRALNEMNKSGRMRFKRKGRIQQTFEKVSVLIQYELGGGRIADVTKKQQNSLISSLTNQTSGVLKESGRIIKCMLEYATESGLAQAVISCHKLRKALQQRVWEDSPWVSRQLKGLGIGRDISARIAGAGGSSFSKILCMTPESIENATRRRNGFGLDVLTAVTKLPKVAIDASVRETWSRISGSGMPVRQQHGAGVTSRQCTLQLKLENTNWLPDNRREAEKHVFFVCAVCGDDDSDHVILMRRLTSAQLASEYSFPDTPFEAPLGSTEVTIEVIHEELVGLDTKMCVNLLGARNEGGSNSKNKTKHKKKKKKTEPGRHRARTDSDFSGHEADMGESLSDNDPSYQDFNAHNPARLASGSSDEDETSGEKCRHRCKNKLTCAHDCCKVGLRSKRRRKTVSTTGKAAAKTSSSPSGCRRLPTRPPNPPPSLVDDSETTVHLRRWDQNLSGQNVAVITSLAGGAVSNSSGMARYGRVAATRSSPPSIVEPMHSVATTPENPRKPIARGILTVPAPSHRQSRLSEPKRLDMLEDALDGFL